MKKYFALAAIVATVGNMQAQTLAEFAEKGDAAMNEQKYELAIENYIKAQELDKDNSDYLTAMQLGVAYQAIGENVKAGDAFKTSLLKGNYDQGVITNMKNAYEAASKPELVKQAYIDIKTANADQKLAMDTKLYYIYNKEKDWANALPCCLTILSDPNIDQDKQLKFYQSAAQLYLNLEQADSAEVYYDKVLAIDPTNANVHKALGFGLYNTIQKIKKSAEATYNAKKSDAKNASHYYAEMQTATKRAWLKYGPKAKEHLKIANQSLKDAQITQILQQIDQNVAAYSK